MVKLIGMLVVLLALPAVAGAQDSAPLKRAFDAYRAAVMAGNLDQLLALFSAETAKETREETKDPENVKDLMHFASLQMPESYQVQHVAWGKNGDKATLYLLGEYAAMPEIERARMQAEASVNFKHENGDWKIERFRVLADPKEIKHPKDVNYDPENAKEEARSEIAGRVVSSDFRSDCTVVILRVLDEEDAIFLPTKAVLEKAGRKAEDYAPWKMLVFSGHPHRTDPLKFFATGDHDMEE